MSIEAIFKNFMLEKNIQKIVQEVFALYELYGNDDYIGEPVSQLEHMCQSAALAEHKGYDEEFILAAFFHDIGHLCEHIMEVSNMEGVGVVDHESIGMEFLLERGFSWRLGLLVKNHVEAKRYLTFKYPEYYAKLSDASKKTLSFQGGVMTEEEAINFENDPLFNDYIKMRTIDDLAKVQHLPLPDLNHYKAMAERHLLDQFIKNKWSFTNNKFKIQ